MIIPFFFNNHNNFAQINGKMIKPYQQNEQRENKETKLVSRKKIQILSNKDMSPNKFAKTQQTKFKTCEVRNNNEKNYKTKREKNQKHNSVNDITYQKSFEVLQSLQKNKNVNINEKWKIQTPILNI
jgi:hypothetical protein